MLESQLEELFQKYLQRSPSQSDKEAHISKEYDQFEIELQNCEERKSSVPTTISSNKNVAMLLSGHIRDSRVLGGLDLISKNFNLDTFVHTWDNYGVKGREMILDDETNPNQIKEYVLRISSLADYRIENNRKFIKQLPKSDVIYFNYSSPEEFIKSQLYSIHQSYKMMEEYSIKHNKKYDIVIRSRFDLEITKFHVDEYLMGDINKNIIFCPNAGSGHDHPDYGTSCKLCDEMYYKHGLRRTHLTDHTSIPCDIFAYSSMSAMKDYCDLYNHYDAILKRYELENLASMMNNDIKYKLEGNVYRILDSSEHLKSIYYLHCSYPEKLLMLHLKKYMLVSSPSDKVRISK